MLNSNIQQQSPLKSAILNCGIPGFTGHLPGYYSENLHGHSYGFLTARRSDMLNTKDEEVLISKYRQDFKSNVVESSSPYKAQIDVSAKRPRAVALPLLNLSKVTNEPISLADTNPLCRMPGYTGHIPHAQIEENLGTSYAKSAQQGYLSARGHLKTSDGSPRRVWTLNTASSTGLESTENINNNNNTATTTTTTPAKNSKASTIGRSPRHHLYNNTNNNNNSEDIPTDAALARKMNTPIVGYSGFIPNYKDIDPSLQFSKGLNSARTMKSEDLEKLATQTMSPHPPPNRTNGAPLSARTAPVPREDKTSQPDRKSGYTGYKPQAPREADVYSGTIGAKGTGLYFGDLTQYWTLDSPYKTTYTEATQNAPKITSRLTPRKW